VSAALRIVSARRAAAARRISLVRSSVRPSAAYVLLARYLRNQWTEFHRTLVDDEVEGTLKLFRF